MDKKGNSFYDLESVVYSKKRYQGVTRSYTQYFFKRRLSLVLRLLGRIGGKNLKLLDIGCADGIMTISIHEHFPEMFSELVGVDVSSAMIEVARKATSDPQISFFLKSETPNKRFDIALSLGYLSAVIFEDEARFVSDHLKSDGYYICALAGRDSLHRRLKLGNVPYLSDFRAYSEYDKMLRTHFLIVKEIPYGLFVPKLWSMPFLARILQPVFEVFFAHIAPNLFHEKIYLLKLK